MQKQQTYIKWDENMRDGKKHDTMRYKIEYRNILCQLRDFFGNNLAIIDHSSFYFCWITLVPMFQLDEQTCKITFSQNPFSMPKVTLETIETTTSKEDLLDIETYQHDRGVCNGIELSSGAIRNRKLEQF